MYKYLTQIALIEKEKLIIYYQTLPRLIIPRTYIGNYTGILLFMCFLQHIFLPEPFTILPTPLYWPDPEGAAHVESFQFLSVVDNRLIHCR